MLIKKQLLAQVTALGPGPTIETSPSERYNGIRSYQAGMTGGTVSVVRIEVSDDAKTWIEAGTFTLAAGSAEGLSSEVPWRFARAYVVANAGGGAIDAMTVLGSAG